MTFDDSSSLFLTRMDDWFAKWHLSNISDLTAGEVKKALEELEVMADEYNFP